MYRALQKFPDLDCVNFLLSFKNARRISQGTADAAIEQLMDGTIDEGYAQQVRHTVVLCQNTSVKVLKEHDGRIVYLMMGKGMPEHAAVVMDEHIEVGRRACTAVR